MKNIKILQIGLGSNQGGIESCVVNYFSNINRERICFDFVDIFGYGIAYQRRIIELGGRILRTENCKRRPIKFAFELKKIIVDGKYDIVHIHVLSAANLVPVIVAIVTGKNCVIVHSHNSSIQSGIIRKMMHYINRPVLQNLNVEKWACSIMAGQWLWGKKFEKDNIIFNAIDRTKFVKCKEEREKIRKKLGYNEENIVMGYVGKLAEQKNPFFLLEIVKRLYAINKKFRLLVIGDGVLGNKFKKRVESYGLTESVFLAGKAGSVVKWYQAMDLFLLPSLFEGLPMVGVEAQAVGLKCFFSNHITHEADITGNVVFLPIDQGAEIWISHILNYIYGINTDRSNNFCKDYDIAYAAKRLEDNYQFLVKNSNCN